jgi:DNA-binding NarL/FixJ family response regulator
MSSNRPRILIANGHILVADLCKTLLDAEFDVIGTVSTGRAMVQAAAELRPDVIVVDIAMPVLNGLDAGQQVKDILPLVKLVFLTMNSDIDLAAEAFRRGASGYLLLKTCTALEMLRAVHEVLRGNSYMSQTLCEEDVNCLRRKGKQLLNEGERLTERQREVLQLLAEGKAMKEVGNILNMTTRTVAFHKYRMMNRLRARSNAELVHYAIRHHIVAA